jgi:hypothetical protein
MPFEYSKWAFRFALPYAKIFWSLIAALFAYAVAAHVSRLPRVFRDRREMSEKSQATSALSAAEATTSLTK